LSIILAAARFAALKHNGIFRKYTNQPYIIHPARVAGMVSVLPHSTEEMVATAWLHDVVEDCGVSEQTINELFGNTVYSTVVYLTNPSKKHKDLPRYLRKKMDREWIGVASKEAKIIKMIDRIDNLKDYPVDDPQAYDFVRNTYFKESVSLFNYVKDADNLVAKEYLDCLDEIKVKFNIGAK